MSIFKDNYSSDLLRIAIEELASLPGIGRKSALRFALHLLRQPRENVEKFSRSIMDMRSNIRRCNICNMISDTDICPICRDRSRDRSLICVVESIRDVISIENTGQFSGVYHVLDGIISPADGVGPSDLNIVGLITRIEQNGNFENAVKEVFLALNTTMEGETTAFYIYKKIAKYDITVSTIARGIGFGDEIEYADEVTLGLSIKDRKPYGNAGSR